MFGILAKSFMTATRSGSGHTPPEPQDLPRLRWLDEDLPFRHHAGWRSGRDD